MIRKLYSPKDTLLGMIVFPDEWMSYIEQNGHVRMAIVAAESFAYMGESGPISTNVRTFVLCPVGHVDRHGLRLYGCSLEEFEKIPRCGFMPGAGYLRGMLE